MWVLEADRNLSLKAGSAPNRVTRDHCLSLNLLGHVRDGESSTNLPCECEKSEAVGVSMAATSTPFPGPLGPWSPSEDDDESCLLSP